MSERGFIAVARGVLDHPVVGARQPFSEFEAWLWLLFEAAWKPRRVRVTNGRAVGLLTLERGQLTYSRSYLVKAWGWTDKSVRGFLDRLERDRQIARQTGHLQTVITICNYELYQNPLSAKGQQAGQQTDRQRAGKGPETEQGNKITSDGVESARDYSRSPISKEAIAFADELTQIAGHDPSKASSLCWFNSQPGVRVQMMIDQGWQIDVMRQAAKRVMSTKRDGPPSTIKYFDQIFARAHAPQAALPPIPEIQEKPYAETREYDPTDWRARRDRGHAALAELRASVRADEERRAREGEGCGPPALHLVSDARRG